MTTEQNPEPGEDEVPEAPEGDHDALTESEGDVGPGEDEADGS